ncbi:hypothetical protein [Streptomyces cucumeris]|uniref:hypothetical protein n=1 Tax=Streptomyces cucumeris TaxID=2962890 RepID=UPI003D716682
MDPDLLLVHGPDPSPELLLEQGPDLVYDMVWDLIPHPVPDLLPDVIPDPGPHRLVRFGFDFGPAPDLSSDESLDRAPDPCRHSGLGILRTRQQPGSEGSGHG